LIADGFADQDSLLADAFHERGHRVEVASLLKHRLPDGKIIRPVNLIIAAHPSPFGNCLAAIASIRLQQPEIGIILRTADSLCRMLAKALQVVLKWSLRGLLLRWRWSLQ